MTVRTRTRATTREPAQRRSRAKLIRFSPEELTRVVERARAAGQTPARFVREAAVGGSPRPRHAPLTDDVVRELARIGVVLRDLAPTVHEQDAARGAAFDAALAAVLDVIRVLR